MSNLLSDCLFLLAGMRNLQDENQEQVDTETTEVTPEETAAETPSETPADASEEAPAETSEEATEETTEATGDESQVDPTLPNLGSDCFGAPTELAGSALGVEFSDETYLQEELRGDMRIWGFNVCIHSNGVVSGFGLVVAPNYGHGEIETKTEEVQEVGERSTEVDGDTIRLVVGGQEVN